ncbi:MAG: C45 family autoproteolytic acyltransferase/hydrolase [SAR324 cluster bacterium]|jgi:predicted choloylglycine hydrolase|nr:C45 family autoproteolytic acyltransferase/hydrolase [SAR324 cluster bacterium]
MTDFQVKKGDPVFLSGSAFERGCQQAKISEFSINEVKEVINRRLQELKKIIWRKDVQGLIGDLKKFHLASDPKIMEEIKGIGIGFGINEDDLFLYLNSSLLTDYSTLSTITEGCTAFAVTDGKGKVFLGKNRDYRSDHISIQKVFLHSDPEWGKRKLLCIGSLGSPGNFSSGMNSEGLVVADTASRVKYYGVGCHRYFLMTRLLVNCSNVQEALQVITSTKNAGGGNLVLADSHGYIATVELAHKSVSIDLIDQGWLARTNHFISELLNKETLDLPQFISMLENSKARLKTVRRLLDNSKGEWTFEKIAKILLFRGNSGEAALCREEGELGSQTISGIVYDPKKKHMWFAAGSPMLPYWQQYSFG